MRMLTELVWLAVTNILVIMKIHVNIHGIGLMRMIIVKVVNAGKSIGWNIVIMNGNSLPNPITVDYLKTMAETVVFLMQVCIVA